MKNQPSERYIKKYPLLRRFTENCEDHKISYVYTHTGWGKTTTIKQWLKKVKLSYEYLSAECENDMLNKLRKLNVSEISEYFIIVIDDFHAIHNPAVREMVIDLISESADCVRFFILGRVEMCAELKPYIVTRQLVSYTFEDFRFTEEECVSFFTKNNKSLILADQKRIFDDLNGYPLGLNFLIQHISFGEQITDEIIEKTKNDVYDYYDVVLFKRWDLEMQDFLVKIAVLDEITPHLANMVTLRTDSHKLIEKLCEMVGYLKREDSDKYILQKYFRGYLQKKCKEILDFEEIRRLYIYAGNYYAMLDNKCEEALKYYHAAGDIKKIKELLANNARNSVEYSSYCKLEQYYRMLSEEAILENPMLCSAVSMMHSVCLRIEESEYWYQKLIEMKQTISKKSPEYLIIEEQIGYLSIALPHKGTRGIISLLNKTGKKLQNTGFKMQKFTITGNMPSILHGGKDFYLWSRYPYQFREITKDIVLELFGKAAMGLLDIAIGEALYEQNSLDSALLELTKGTSESRNRGTIEVLFAGVAVLSRLLVAKGEFEAAMNMMDGLRIKIVQKNKNDLLKNFESYFIRLQLNMGINEKAEKWLLNQAPDENVKLCTAERTRYMTKARLYIITGSLSSAEILLERLRKNFSEYHMVYEYMEATILEAIIYFRNKDERYVELMNEALRKADKYNFIRIFADEGAAVQPLLLKMKKLLHVDIKIEFFKKVMSAVNEQATLYPAYLKANPSINNALTRTELSVLRLLEQGKPYNDIEKDLDISLNTVKFHAKNIYTKLDVPGRAGAIKVGKELKIL